MPDSFTEDHHIAGASLYLCPRLASAFRFAFPSARYTTLPPLPRFPLTAICPLHHPTTSSLSAAHRRLPHAPPSHLHSAYHSPPPALYPSLPPFYHLLLTAVGPQPTSPLKPVCHTPPSARLRLLPTSSPLPTHRRRPAPALPPQGRLPITSAISLQRPSTMPPSAKHHRRPATALPHRLRQPLTAVAHLDRPPTSTPSAAHILRHATALKPRLRLPLTAVVILFYTLFCNFAPLSRSISPFPILVARKYATTLSIS